MINVKVSELTEKHACTKGAETDVCFLCCDSPLALKATNSPVNDRQSAVRSKCSGSIVFPVSNIVDFKLCI